MAASDTGKVDPDKMTFKESKKIFNDEGDVDDAFEEKKRILIAGYRVGFMLNAVANVMEEGEKSQISNFSGADRVTYFVKNPDKHLSAVANLRYDNALLQEIAEEGYADLQARMKSVGREIVSMEDLKTSAGYKSLEIAQPDAKGQYLSEDDNGGLADVNYIAKKPNSIPMWFGMANPLDKGGAMSKAASALSQKNVDAFKQLAIDSDAVILDMTFRVRPAWVEGIRPKMFRSASVKADPYLVVLPEPIMIQTYKKTWVGNVPSSMGALRVELPDFMDSDKAQKFAFNYGYDYGEFKVGENIVDRSFFVPAYEKTTIVNINPDRAKFKAAVLHALKTTNATLAQWAKENPAK
jgi:hypothetical protein